MAMGMHRSRNRTEPKWHAVHGGLLMSNVEVDVDVEISRLHARILFMYVRPSICMYGQSPLKEPMEKTEDDMGQGCTHKHALVPAVSPSFSSVFLRLFFVASVSLLFRLSVDPPVASSFTSLPFVAAAQRGPSSRSAGHQQSP